MKHLLVLALSLVAFYASVSAVPAFCQLPHDDGTGESFMHFLYYDPTYDRCNPFVYRGNGGNDNRFKSEKDCIRNCSAKAEETYPMEASKACLFKKAPGDCGGTFLSFYYDPIHNKCKLFKWTGCHGNGNRFFNSSLCNSTCAGIHVDGDEVDEAESDTPIAIICGVLLAVIITVVLITVIVLTVKSKKKNSKTKVKAKAKDPQVDSPLQEQALEMA